MTVTVVDPSTDADNNTPTAKAQTVNKEQHQILNNQLIIQATSPSGTTFAYKDPVDTTTAGNKSAVVVVTYPDGSKDEVPVTVTVVDQSTDADNNTPTAKSQTVNKEQHQILNNQLIIKVTFQVAQTFAYKDPVDTTTAGNKST